MLLLLLLGRDALAQGRWEVTAEVGPELDTNTLRVMQTRDEGTEEPLLSGLAHLMARGAVGFSPAPRHLLSLGYGGGAKLFWLEQAREADEVVQHADLGWSFRVRPEAALWLGGSYYDAFQRDSQRDFRTGAGMVRGSLLHRRSGLLASALLGYRGLQYKPDVDIDPDLCVDRTDAESPWCARFSFHGPLGGATLRWSLTSGEDDELVDWTIELSYTGSYRAYAGLVRGQLERCPATSTSALCFNYKDHLREDLNHLVRAEVTYLGPAEAALWYSAEVNTSNSFGATFTRHVVGLKFTARFFWDLYFTAKGALQLSQFTDPLDVSVKTDQSLVDFEEENRSSFTVQLARDLAPHWSLALRYSLYVNESATRGDADEDLASGEQLSYLRQTLFLGVRFEHEGAF